MQLPQLTEYDANKDTVEEFLGYDHNLRTATGEWYDTKNMTADYYPLASPRDKRSLQQSIKECIVSIDDENYTSNGFLSMAYTDNQLILLQQLFNENSEQIGCCFTNNGIPVLTGYDKKSIYLKWSYTYRINGTTIFTKDDYVASERWFYFVSQSENEVIFFDADIGLYYKTAVLLNSDYSMDENIVDTGINIDYGDDPYYYKSVYNEESILRETANSDFMELSNQTDIWANYAPYFEATENKRQLVRNGSYICVFPDGVIYETENTDDATPVKKIAESVNINPLTDGGEEISYIRFRTYVEDSSSEQGYKTIELVSNIVDSSDYTSETYRVADGELQRWLPDYNMWTGCTAYTAIYFSAVDQSSFDALWALKTTDLFGNLREGDTVTIKLNAQDTSSQIVARTFGTFKTSGMKGMISFDDKESNTFNEISAKIIKKGIWLDGEREYILVKGLIYTTYDDSSYSSGTTRADGDQWAYIDNTVGITITRKCPDIAFACESQNRVWGCSKDGHEIYASALGDPYNFYDYSGISTDSYAVNVGTDGKFTGCCNYLGYPLFFKENALHYISGNYPEEYLVTTYTDFKGVEKGSENSLAIIDNILYYKSSAGIVAYDGSTTSVISSALGKDKYKNAVAGACKNKYYVSMQKVSDGKYHLFSYDTSVGIWCREDETEVLQFLNVTHELIFSTDENIYCVEDEEVLSGDSETNGEYKTEDDFEWYAETGNYGYSYPNNKYLSRFQIRMQIAQGARAAFYIQYNSDGTWHRKAEMYGKGIKTFLVPIVPMRCDHMKIKIEGKGDAKIYSIAKILEEGGDT